ncbi:hypothetical protein EUX98_g7865 [Antrodiella citrinella]|uniref:NADP-dependent oxidoreductase domain-containing protein n=1 Tax=Antrodiella citrinella TaxID=2447956 RepID=A0A4S4MKS2_9APHY|nr:hypothetical protein EUX98_g7865 [Antrodiella citrinella]
MSFIDIPVRQLSNGVAMPGIVIVPHSFPYTMAIDEDGKVILSPVSGPIPIEKPSFNDVWAEFEKVYAGGKARAIGVSNFSIKTLEQLLTTAKIMPHVNQVEYADFMNQVLTHLRRLHPYLAQPELKAYCDGKGIQLCAYTPTGEFSPTNIQATFKLTANQSGLAVVRSDPTIGELAQKYAATPAQIILAWHIMRGVVPTPQSSDPR